MSETRLKTAVLGLKDAGRILLEALCKTEHLGLEAVADEDAETAESFAERYNCAGYSDYRQLIIQNRFDCLLVAAGMHSCAEYIKMAMKKKFNILKLAPLGRNFAEAAELVSLAEQQDITFAVANTNRFARGFIGLRRFLQENPAERFFLINAVCYAGGKLYPAWQTDLKLAGGGVLLYNCYEIIDQILWTFTTPQQVYCLNNSQAGDKQQRLYKTEDTAIVTMKFTDTLIGNLTASRTFCPGQKLLKLHGKDKMLTASENLFSANDLSGRVIEQSEYEDNQLTRMGALLEKFASTILTPDKNRLTGSARENLRNMAVIESAYLSSRTAMPEQPDRILKMTALRSHEPVNIHTADK